MYSSFRFFLFSSILSNPRRVSTLAQSMGESKEDVFVCTRHIYIYRSQRRKGRGSWSGVGGDGGTYSKHVIFGAQLSNCEQILLRLCLGLLLLHRENPARQVYSRRLEVGYLAPEVLVKLTRVHHWLVVTGENSRGRLYARDLNSAAARRMRHERAARRHGEQEAHFFRQRGVSVPGEGVLRAGLFFRWSGKGVSSGQACAQHRRKQRRAAHVIVVPLQVPLHVHLHHSVGLIGVHSENISVDFSTERSLILRFESSFWMTHPPIARQGSTGCQPRAPSFVRGA